MDMLKVKLLETCHIPDETWTKSEEHPVQPVATNYAGAVLDIPVDLAVKFVHDRRAVALNAKGETIEIDEDGNEVKKDAAPSALEERVARTFGGGSE